MKEQEKDHLRSLFQDMELSNPPQGFENRLMQQIQQVAAQKLKKQTLRSKIVTAISIAVGIAAMVALPLVIFYFITGNIGFGMLSPLSSLKLARFSAMDISPMMVLLPSVILILVMGDTLIRKHLSDKRHHDI